MRKLIAFFLLAVWMLVPISSQAAVRYQRHRSYYHSSSSRYYRHKRHVRTLKRVGIGAGGGAVVGALAGGGKGAGIGALAGGAGGYIYDRYKRHHNR